MRTGRLTLPMTAGRQRCMDVRLGRLSLAEVVRSIDDLEAELSLLTYGTSSMPDASSGRRDLSNGRSPLPLRADWSGIDDFLVEAYTEAWGEIWRDR